MKEIKSSKLAFTYAGCFVGAGFLSGNELWQFFGSFGKWGVVFLVVAIILQAVLGYFAIRYAGENNITRFDVLIVKKNNTLLRAFFVVTEMLFIFFVVSVMLAGAGSLFNTVFGVGEWWTSLIFTVAVMLVAYYGLNGVISVLSSTIPVLTFATILVSIIALIKFGLPNFNLAPVTGKTWMLPNVFVSAILFSVHNLYCTLGVVTPLGARVKNKNVALQGMTFASIVLFLISIAVLCPLYANLEYATKALPMLELAKLISGPLFYVYAFLMLIGMFGTAISHTVAVTDFCEQKFEKVRKKKLLLIIPLGVLAYAVSLFGFNDLIAFMYPLSGYIGIIAIIMITINFFTSRKNKKEDN
ncbi:MAG: hypothetical protein J6R88_02800 [Clostridia bacterium]|nr:hypothetical protein [Clostridia bacterium]